MQDKLKEFVKANREAFDNKAPDPDIWNRIRPQVVPAVCRGRRNKFFYGIRVAAAILCVGAVGVAVFLNQREDGRPTSPVAEARRERPAAAPGQPGASSTVTVPRIASGRQVDAPGRTAKVTNTANTASPVEHPGEKASEKLVQGSSAIALLQDSVSSSNRLLAVLTMGRSDAISGHELTLLEKAAVSDPSTNVRMAAAELWLAQQQAAYRHEKIQQLFVAQDDPTMQVELLQEMAADQGGTINEQTREKLTEIVEDPFALSFLKERAYAVLLEQYN